MDENQPAQFWQRELKSKIAWAMVAKVLGLTLLWLLFFRGNGS